MSKILLPEAVCMTLVGASSHPKHFIQFCFSVCVCVCVCVCTEIRGCIYNTHHFRLNLIQFHAMFTLMVTPSIVLNL